MAELVAKEPPYGIDYCKHETIKCKGCQIIISENTLKMSIRQPSKFYDGIDDTWYHFTCFPEIELIKRSETLSIANVRGHENLEWKDQEKIVKLFNRIKAKIVQPSIPSTSNINSNDNINIPDVRRIRNSLRNCQKCEQKIMKGELRIKLQNYLFHLECSKSINLINKYKPQELQGFCYLFDEDKEELFNVFDAKMVVENDVDTDEPLAKKSRTESSDINGYDLEENKLRKQAEILWKVKNDIKEYLEIQCLDVLFISCGFTDDNMTFDEKIDQLVDYIVFGKPDKCYKCRGNGIIIYNPSSHNYTCTGYLTEYTKCTYQTKNPIRKPFIIPTYLKNDNPFLRNQNFPTLSKRLYPSGIDKIQSVHELFGEENDGLPEAKDSIVKNGCSVDGDCEVAEIAHVYIDDKKVAYQVTLGETCFYENKNSYYKLQVLQHDKENKYYIYCAQGRIGSNRGARRTIYYDDDKNTAVNEFKKLFYKLTGNEWECRRYFCKKRGKMDLIELEYNSFTLENKKFNVEQSTSLLPKSVKELIAMIFDIESINKTLKAMNYDTVKMPLGKLSSSNIKSANDILKKLESLLASPCYNKDEILDYSNKFYSKIPHVTGDKPPPLLNNIEMIYEKARMLDELNELEITYSILNTGQDNLMDPIDTNYEKLKCVINPLSKYSPVYKLIQDYAEDTHGPTHGVKLKVVDIFEIYRSNESEQYKSYLGNKRLLWHGSRTTNYAGILSKGLRIAPKEAASNGAMFGKGIYFADIVTKSANYCGVYGGGNKNNEGLLLLCEVALGEIQEETAAKNYGCLPFGKLSVKGCGSMIPDPSGHVTLGDDVLIPKGRPIKKDNFSSSLIYNEYIVYDVAQVRIRYLIKAKFMH